MEKNRPLPQFTYMTTVIVAQQQTKLVGMSDHFNIERFSEGACWRQWPPARFRGLLSYIKFGNRTEKEQLVKALSHLFTIAPPLHHHLLQNILAPFVVNVANCQV